MNKKLRSTLITTGFVLLFAAILFFSWFSRRITPVPAGTVGNSAGNANNGGLFCEYDGMVYFSNPYDSGALYSMRPDETQLTKLADADVCNLNAGGDYLFYYQKDSTGSNGLGYVRPMRGIYRSKLNGTGASKISDDLVFNMQLIGGSLYYLTSNADGPLFYKLSPDGDEKALLSTSSMNLACASSDGTAYFQGMNTNHYLYSYDTATDTSTVIWRGNLFNPLYDDGYVYYMDVSSDYQLCRYSLADNYVQVLTTDRVDCFNLAGGYIYYQKNSATEPALMRVSMEGGEAETIMSGIYTGIHVTSQYVYFTPFENGVPLYRIPVSGPATVTIFEP